jgi:acetyl esterase/lipase
MRRWAPLVLTYLALSAGLPSTAAAVVTDVRVTSGIVYGQGQVTFPAPATVNLLLDLYQPVTTTPYRRPAVVLIHGGGFRDGTRPAEATRLQPELAQVARGLAWRGVIVANIDYRLNYQKPVNSARVAPLSAASADFGPSAAMVAAVDDTLTAIRWLRTHATELNFARRRLGVVGSSAGAMTACHVGYTLDDYGVHPPHLRFVGDLWGGIFFDTQLNASQLDAGEPPLFAVHGTADTLVPVIYDDRLVARARAVGVRASYYRIEGGEHSFGGTGFFTREVAPGKTAFDRLLHFAHRALRPRGFETSPPA